MLAIEPMVSAGTDETVVLDDGWSVLTADGAWAAHTEHTVAVTDDGPEILTVVSSSSDSCARLRAPARDPAHRFAARLADSAARAFTQ